MAIYELEPRIYYDAALPVDIAHVTSHGYTNGESHTSDNSSHNNNFNEHPDSRDPNTDEIPDIVNDHHIGLDESDMITVDDNGLADFGDSVAIDGNYAVVGAKDADGTGAVYIFKHTKSGEWKMIQKIIADDGKSGDNFGVSVAIYKDTIVVGADGVDDAGDNAGAIYIFENNGGEWMQINKITAIDGNAGDGFGESVDIYGDFIVVGAAGDDDAGENSGSVYVFEEENGEWMENSKIVADDAEDNAAFGDDVAVDHDNIVVGASGDNDTGSAYLFKYDGYIWREQAKFHGSDSTTGDNFGAAVDIDGKDIIIGAWGNDAYGEDAGAVYVFTHTREGLWKESVLHASDSASGDNFGIDVQIDHGHIIIGASGKDNGAGAAYAFRETPSGFIEMAKFTVDNGQPGSHFGSSVALSGKTVLIGAPDTADYTGEHSGAAYIPQANNSDNIGDDDIPVDDDDIPDINDLDDSEINPDDNPFDDVDDLYGEEGEGEGEEGEGEEGEGDWTDLGEGGNNNGENSAHIPGHIIPNTGPYNFGVINPPHNSNHLPAYEQINVQFFDARNMQTAFSMPNGEFQIQADSNAPIDVFRNITQSNQYVENTAFNAEMSYSELSAGTTASALNRNIDPAANNIINEYIGSITETEHENNLFHHQTHENPSLNQLIHNFFLSDEALHANGINSSGELNVPPMPHHLKHPAFRDSLEKSIDAIFGF